MGTVGRMRILFDRRGYFWVGAGSFDRTCFFVCAGVLLGACRFFWAHGYFLALRDTFGHAQIPLGTHRYFWMGADTFGSTGTIGCGVYFWAHTCTFGCMRVLFFA